MFAARDEECAECSVAHAARVADGVACQHLKLGLGERRGYGANELGRHAGVTNRGVVRSDGLFGVGRANFEANAVRRIPYKAHAGNHWLLAARDRVANEQLFQPLIRPPELHTCYEYHAQAKRQGRGGFSSQVFDDFS